MPATTRPKEAISFGKSVSKGGSGDVTYDVQADATVERVTVRFYRGQELDLQLTPFIKTGNGERKIDLVQLAGKSYIDGDGDFFEFDVGEEVTKGDQIGVHFDNKESNYAYNFRVNVELDKEGGTARAMGLLDRLKGVF